MALAWTHACCGECWFTRHPEKAALGPPVRVLGATGRCCYCGKDTVAGIYLRGNAAETPCKGMGPEHA